MFGKMMNSFYYGKSGKGDYNKEDLPKNRWQLFWEMLRIRFSALVRLNLMYLVAWIPAIIVIVISFLAWYAQIGDMVEGTTSAADYASMTYSLIFQGLLMLIPCILITGPVTAGVSYVTRNWARDEHAFIWSDFKDAVKDNWKQAFAVSAISAIAPFLIYMCWNFYGEMVKQSAFFYVPQILVLMLGFIWYLASTFAYPLMVTYKLKFRELMRNSVLLAIGRLPQTLGVRLVMLVPFIIAALLAFFVVSQIQWVILGLLLYYILIGFSLSRFVYASFTNGVFDKYINGRIEGVEVNRGMNLEEDDEEEEDDGEEDK